jgi:hypothetical protein
MAIIVELLQKYENIVAVNPDSWLRHLYVLFAKQGWGSLSRKVQVGVQNSFMYWVPVIQ